MRKKAKKIKCHLVKWNPMVTGDLETTVCVYRDSGGDWEAFPIYVFHHGQLGRSRWRCDADSSEVFSDNRSEPERTAKLQLDDAELVEELKSCVADAPTELFGGLQLMTISGNDDKVVYIVAKRIPAPPVASKPEPAGRLVPIPV